MKRITKKIAAIALIIMTLAMIAPYHEFTQVYASSVVKEAGKSDEPLAFSSAQVSQDNLAQTLVKSAGLVTSTDYGPAYSEVPEGETVERYHFFEFDHENNTYLAPYKVTGAGSDFKNWHLEELILIGDLYK